MTYQRELVRYFYFEKKEECYPHSTWMTECKLDVDDRRWTVDVDSSIIDPRGFQFRF